MSRGRVKLAVVPNGEPSPEERRPEPRAKRTLSPEEEAERQRRRDHWAKVHITGDRSAPINLASRSRRIFSLGGGIRSERGGFKFDERA